jgi:cell division protein FtsB
VLAVGLLYWKPLRSYVQTREVLDRREREVSKLREQKRQLEQRIATVATNDALTREARRLGLVKPGERLFIVRGISTWRKTH